MAESKRNTATLVGLFLLIGSVLLGVLIVQFGRFGERFIGKYTVTIVFDDASGIIRGSEVRMGGARIGEVATVPMLNDDVKVEVEIDVDDRIRIPAGSSFQIASATILGDKLIVITPPEQRNGEFIEPDAVVQGGGPSGLDAIQNNAEVVAREARRLLENAGDTMTAIDSAVADIRQATGELNSTLRRINAEVLSETNLDHVEGLLANLEQASRTLAPTLEEARDAVAQVGKAAESARETFAHADERIDDLRPALENVSRAANKAADTLDQVESGDGLLGTLAYDEDVSNDAKVFIRNLRQQGILRYRDKDNPEDDPRNRFRSRRR